METRRELIGLFSAIVGACACGQAHARQSYSDGCFLGAAAARSFQSNYEIRPTSGDRNLDYTMLSEAEILASNFGYRPGFFFFQESAEMGGNAFATTQNIDPAGSHGSVVFGLNLLFEELTRSWWGAAVVGIMAHEWAHIRQQNMGLAAATPVKELHADYMAGWYLGMKERAGNLGRTPLSGLANSLFSKGDYQFNNPDHHGTPRQRVSAMTAGFDLVRSHYIQDIGRTYDAGLRYLGYR